MKSLIALISFALISVSLINISSAIDASQDIYATFKCASKCKSEAVFFSTKCGLRPEDCEAGAAAVDANLECLCGDEGFKRGFKRCVEIHYFDQIRDCVEYLDNECIAAGHFQMANRRVLNDAPTKIPCDHD